ncbi:MAG: ABC transporter ATP-binding protein [Candidatus Koribacter versatilis]|uniref:ABC transporter ATP-binding protein n=1 Tax=Candidatus Korobacter versatilis TaxID=658062 RepID=A0A932A7N8_9BACT|nr:ABC transporter ATP-binding protein [Candidatus Koribacter versatilis]
MSRASASPNVDAVVLESVSKVFRHRPALLNLAGRERSGETRALDGVSLSARSGEILVLLGPNGGGKTTLLKLVGTILLPDSGSVRVNGLETRTHGDAARRTIGFAVANERSFFPRLTAFENLDLFGVLEDLARKERHERVDWTLATTGLAAARNTLVMKFSSGMYQRLGVARALLKRPRVLLLDEPTRSLDVRGAEHLWQVFRQIAAEGSTVLLATHDFDEAAALGSEVVILQRGVIRARERLAGHSSIDALRAFYLRETQSEEGEADATRNEVRR